MKGIIKWKNCIKKVRKSETRRENNIMSYDKGNASNSITWKTPKHKCNIYDI